MECVSVSEGVDWEDIGVPFLLSAPLGWLYVSLFLSPVRFLFSFFLFEKHLLSSIHPYPVDI